jgi:peptide/nickel transport system substrate-binding protein
VAAELKPIQEINLASFTKAQYLVAYEAALLVAENWKKLGMQVRVDPLNYPNPFIERWLKTNDFDAFSTCFVGQPDRQDPDFYTYACFHSSNAVPGGWNAQGFVNKEFDKLAEAQREEYDLEKRKVLVDQCQEILYRENPWLITISQNEFHAYNKANFKDPVFSIQGFKDTSPFFTIKPTGARRVLRVAAAYADLNSINPLLVSETSQVRVINLMYDMLVKYAVDGKPHPWAAKEVKAINPTTLDVTIRNDLKFHDGKALTAEDVKFSFDFLIKHNAPYYKAALNSVESVNVLDKYRVRFKLKKPYAPFIPNTLGMTPLLPKHIWEKIEKPTEYRNIPLIGSGPFKFDHWREAREFKMSRFAEHFKPANVDGLLFIFYGTREAGYTALIKNEADVFKYVLTHQIDEVKKLDHIQLVEVPLNGPEFLTLNLKRKPFNDPQFRLAMAYTIPKEQILDELFDGHGVLGASVIVPNNKFWTNSKIKPYPFDLEKAREILKNAGYKWDDKGRLCYPAE